MFLGMKKINENQHIDVKNHISANNSIVKYFNTEDANYLLHALQSSGFTVTTDWTGNHYCGLTFDWNYNKGYVDISMPVYWPSFIALRLGLPITLCCRNEPKLGT